MPTTIILSRTSATAVANPMPPDAPVTTATFPAQRFMGASSAQTISRGPYPPQGSVSSSPFFLTLFARSSLVILPQNPQLLRLELSVCKPWEAGARWRPWKQWTARAVYLNVKLGAVMAAATAKSRSCVSICALAAIIFFVGFNLTLAQDHRFRINVYDDYQQQQPVQDYQDYQADQNQNYEVDQRQIQNYRTNQHPNQNYQAVQHQNQNYQAVQHQNFQPDPNQYQKQYQQQFENSYKPNYVKPTTPKKKPKKEGQDFSKIPGVPGVDFPIYHTIPKTSFSCSQVPYLPGMYANVETGCQVYHVCHDGREGEQGASFLCSNGTLFNQNEFACDWWYNVKCHDSFRLYSLNGDATTNPFVPKAKQEEILKGREIDPKLKIVVF